MSKVLTPASLTHHHLALAVEAEAVGRKPHDGVWKILDAGCGGGALTGYLHQTLNRGNLRKPHATRWDIFGFDISDYKEQGDRSLHSTAAHLHDIDGSVSWQQRLSLVPQDQAWPYLDSTFDVVVSNQVLEHVKDLEHFLHELRRVLVPGGVSVHLFPLSSALWEGHLLMPLAAQCSGHEQRLAWIRSMHRLRVGKARHRERGEWGARYATEYVHLQTHYRSWRQFVVSSKRAGLLASYRYTPELYTMKVRQMLTGGLPERFSPQRRPIVDAVALQLTRWVGPIALVLSRPEGLRMGGSSSH